LHDGRGFFIGPTWVDGGGVGGPGCSFGGVGINGGGINTGWRNIDAGFGHIFAGAYWTNISGSEQKRDITPIETSQLDAVLAAPLYHFRYKPTVVNNLATDVESEIGVASVPDPPSMPDQSRPTTQVTEPVLGAAETTIPPEPEVVTGINSGVAEDIAETWRFGPMVEDLPEQVIGETPRGKAPDLVSLVYTAWGAIQELSAKLDTANEKIAALTTRLEAVEA
jgi:hypothetical protein